MDNGGQVLDYAQFTWLFLWVLLPLVPAAFAYLILPGTGISLRGLFSGVTTRSAGAILTYFILLAVAYPLASRLQTQYEANLRPSWEISGTVQVRDVDGKEVPDPSAQGERLRITLEPDLVTTDEREFVAVVPEIDNEVPSLFVDYGSWGTTTIHPTRPKKPGDVEIDRYKKQIRLIAPILIQQTACVGTSCDSAPY